jgi:predicted TIM-barrel fold metal-dependent hydrolase
LLKSAALSLSRKILPKTILTLSGASRLWKNTALIGRSSLKTTPILQGLDAEEAGHICKLSNNAIGKIARQYPDRFIPFAVVSLLDMDEALKELERSVGEWGCKGVTIGANQNNMGLDFAQFSPFWQKVCELDIPVFLHPMHWQSYPICLSG